MALKTLAAATIQIIHHSPEKLTTRSTCAHVKGGVGSTRGWVADGGADDGLPDSSSRGDGMRYHMIMICQRLHAHTGSSIPIGVETARGESVGRAGGQAAADSFQLCLQMK